MRIGVASDSHGNLAALERALSLFERAQAERVFFLGGRTADVEAVMARQPPARRDVLRGQVVRVASKGCPEYESGTVPRKQMDLVDARICCLVHDKAELSRDDIENASVLFHGNSASAGLVQIGPRCFVTPGHLRASAAPGAPPTFALVELTAHELVLTVFSDACVELRQDRAALGTAGKMSVR